MSKNTTTFLCLVGQPLLLNIISIPATAYIIRTLGPLGFGEWSVATSLVAAVTSITNLGLRPLFIRLIAQQPECAGAALAEQLGVRGLLGLLAGLGTLLLCLCLRYPPVVLQCVAIAALGLLFTVLGTAVTDLFQGLQRFKMYAGINLLGGLVLTGAAVATMWYRGGPVGLTIAYLTGPLLILLCGVMVIRRQYFPVRIRWDLTRFRELLKQSRSIAAQNFLAMIQERIEQLLIPKLIGIGALGYFTAGSIPANRLVVLPDGLSTLFYPKIAQSCKDEEQSASLQATRLILIALVICVPLAVLIAFYARPIATLLFPHTPTNCRIVMQVTIWSIPLLAMAMPMSYTMQACGQHAQAARAGMLGTICSVPITVLLVSRYGVQGASWSWIVRNALWTIFLVPRFAQHFPKVLPDLPIARILACAAVMAVLLWMCSVLQVPLALEICGGVVLGILAYVGALLLLRVFHISELSGLLKRNSA